VASEQVLDIPVRRHLLTSERPFQVTLDGTFAGRLGLPQSRRLHASRHRLVVGDITWCAKPTGSPTATINVGSPEDLIAALAEQGA
jgi:hypothetical protein